jgi:glutathione S-transferase
MTDPRAAARARLITIPFSHFCDKARWALDRAGIRYREEGHVPLAHMLPALRAGGRRSVPVLVTEGRVLADSTDILHFADERVPAESSLFFRDAPELRSEAEALEAQFDAELGPASRRVVYHHLLPDPALSLTVMSGAFGPSTPLGLLPPRWLNPTTFQLYFPVARALMQKAMRIDEAGVARSQSALRAVFDRVNERLREGRRFLVGERFSAADLTFAALAVPVLLPPEFPVPMPPPGDFPASLRDLIASLRAEPAGAYGLRLYRDHRAKRLPGP